MSSVSKILVVVVMDKIVNLTKIASKRQFLKTCQSARPI